MASVTQTATTTCRGVSTGKGNKPVNTATTAATTITFVGPDEIHCVKPLEGGTAIVHVPAGYSVILPN